MGTAKKILLPELGEGITEGELVKWLVAKGDSVEFDQALAEVMTDKAVMEIPSVMNGVVDSLLVKEGETVPVGGALLTLTGAEDSKEAAQPVIQKTPPAPPPPGPELSAPSPPHSHKQATPLTRRLARELGVPLSAIKGSGLEGRITKEDVLKYSKDSSSALSPNSAKEERQPFKGIRKKIADTMQESKQKIPHFSLLDSAQVEKLDEMKKSVQEMFKNEGVKITYLAFIMKALLQTVKEFPELNASIDNQSHEILLKKYYNFGFAADTPRGLLVPVIKNVDQKNLKELALAIQELAHAARTSSIKREDMTGGTLTLTNIGSIGGLGGTPIINPPEVMILGIYRMKVSPCWNGENFIPQKTMNFSITCDHRLIDGAQAGRVLKTFIQKIENPIGLFI